MSGQPFRARFGFDADGNSIIDVADPVQGTDAVNLQTLLRETGFRLVGRVGNLPSPSDPDPTKHPVPGRAYLVKYDLGGQVIDRLAVWDDNLTATGPVGAVDVIEPVADAALIAAQAGASDPGKPFNAGVGTGAVLDLTAQADGSITATVANGGANYAIGDALDLPAGSLAWGAAMTGTTRLVVTRLGGSTPNGGWRFITLHDWIKPTKAAADHAYGMEAGDLQATTELGHEELKVWDGTNWVQLVSTDQIKAWISALSLFEGTAKQVGGTAVPGAVELTALVDLAATTPGGATAGVAKVSHYWTWVGTAGYVIKAADPNGVGRDLAGAIMQVGDWLQIANRGTASAPDMHWVHIGGDLLAKSRADVLYGINAWVAGSYEAGSLVNYKGSLYRATGPVQPTDPAPDTAGTPAGPGGVPPAVPGAPWAVIPLTAGVHNVATDANLPASAPASDIYLVLNSTIGGGKPTLFSFDPGANRWIQLGGDTGKGMDLTGGVELASVGLPVGAMTMWVAATAPRGWLFAHGQVFTAAQYPELAKVFPSLRLPDMRGAYPRGAGLNGNGSWGDAANTVGGTQESATAQAKNPFTTDDPGDHDHDLFYQTWGGKFGVQPTNTDGRWLPIDANGPGGAAIGGTRQPRIMSTNGAHTHKITGGDTETRPKTLLVEFIIKAVDSAIVPLT